MKRLFILCALSCVSCLCVAQLKVDSIGRVKVGQDHPDRDGDHVVSMLISGKYGEYNAGGKLSFGDFGLYALQGWNVFIGEYGITDTDQLWLHGKLGTYFTYSNGSVWGYYDVNAGDAFHFNCDVYSNGILLTSDERMKANIRPLSGSLSSLQQLKGVSYFLKKPIMQVPADTQKASDNPSLSDKEKRDVAFFEEWEKELQNSKDLRMGFVAQELKKVFPELVRENKEGLKDAYLQAGIYLYSLVADGKEVDTKRMILTK